MVRKARVKMTRILRYPAVVLWRGNDGVRGNTKKRGYRVRLDTKRKGKKERGLVSPVDYVIYVAALP